MMAVWRRIGLDDGAFALLRSSHASGSNMKNSDCNCNGTVHWEAIARCQQSDFTAGEDREGARAYRITFTTQGIAYYTVDEQLYAAGEGWYRFTSTLVADGYASDGTLLYSIHPVAGLSWR